MKADQSPAPDESHRCICCGFDAPAGADYCRACLHARGAQRAYWGRLPLNLPCGLNRYRYRSVRVEP